MQTRNRRTFLKAALAALPAVAGLPSGHASGTAIARALPRIDGFGGRIIERGNAAYDSWRRGMVWQMRKPDRFPEMILRPENLADVQAAVRFAARNRLRMAVRSGGHQIWGASVRDGGMLLDLSRFRQFSVPDTAGTARVGPSLWARDVLAALEKQDTAFPVAHCPTVPLGGFAMGGGMGLNGDEWDGMAANCILGGTVVVADGSAVPVSETQNADLLWAMRGGAGALPGVVTELQIKTFDRPAAVYSGTYAYPLAALDSALQLLEQVVAARPRQTEWLALMTHNPQSTSADPPDVRKAMVIRVQVYADDEQQAAPVLDAVAAMPAAGQAAFKTPLVHESYEKLFVDGVDWRRGFGFGRFGVENAWTDSPRRAIEAIADEFMRAPSWKDHVVIQPKLSRAVAGDAAFSVAGNTYIGIYSVWENAEEDEAEIAWLRRMSGKLDEHAVGHYINEIDAAEDPRRVRQCYSTAAWARLRNIRKHWDAHQVMHDFPGLS
ncbi:MAG: FAD-binding protein [Gammaproteobacteria bacterium]|nr:FAD-binding protein [Gammaproteobacteria bacterium]